MIKKMIYYGFAMIVVAAILFFGSGYLFSNGLGKNIIANNYTVRQDNFSYLPISYTNASEIAIYVISSKPLNVYLLNNSAYSMWSTHVLTTRNASGLSYVEQLHVNASQIFKNSSFAVIPLFVNSTKNYTNNKVYVVLDNTFGSHSFNSSVNASISYFPLHTSGLIVYELIDVLAFVILAVGIIMIAWGLMKTKQPKPGDSTEKNMPKDEKDKEYVDQLYKGVKKSKRKKSSNQ